MHVPTDDLVVAEAWARLVWGAITVGASPISHGAPPRPWLEHRENPGNRTHRARRVDLSRHNAQLSGALYFADRVGRVGRPLDAAKPRRGQ